MKVFVLILVFTCIILIDVPELLRKKKWGELAVIIVLLSIGFTISLLQIIGVKVPNPDNGIEYIIKLLV